MRKLMISVLAGSLTVAGASAQVKAYKPSKPMEGNTVAYALPRSVVRVQVVAERESVRVGPYARFAQKLLGVMAPLADKDIYTIQSATLCAAQEADPAEVYALDNPDKSPLRIYDVTPEVQDPTGTDDGTETDGEEVPERKRFLHAAVTFDCNFCVLVRHCSPPFLIDASLASPLARSVLPRAFISWL